MRWFVFACFLLGCAAKPEPKPASSTVYLPPAKSRESSSPSEPPARESSQPKDYRNRPPASPEDRARAEQLFQEGRKLINQGEYAAACIKLEQSLDADAALGTLMNIADCRRREGNVAVACSLFHEAHDWAKDTSPERASFIADMLKSLNC